jgi:hypothetical protein
VRLLPPNTDGADPALRALPEHFDLVVDGAA